MVYGRQVPKGMNSSMQSRYLSDPRLALAMELQKMGSGTAPVYSPLEGIARMLTGAVGGYKQQLLQNEYTQRGDDYSKTLAQALQAGAGMPAMSDLPGPSLDGSAGYSRSPVAPDQQMMAQILMGNPDTQDVATKMMLDSAAAKMKANEPVKLGAGDILVNPSTGEAVYTAPPKEQWENVDDPMFGKGQLNPTTGEFKPIKTDVQDPDKANQARMAALEVTNRLLGNISGVKANRGGISTLFPNVSDSAVNAEADLETLASLLTTENLGLLKGVLSDTDMKILKDIGAGGLKGADAQVINNLKTIQAKLQGQTGDATPSAPAKTPQAGQEEDGYVFLGGDPSNPASWRKK